MSRNRLKKLAKNIRRNHGDALAAEKVIAQARRVGKTCVVPGSSTHQIQELSLTGNVLCIIDKPFRFIDQGMKLRNNNPP